MQISDLPRPVIAAKTDWLPSTVWMGFTPQGKGSDAAQKCEAVIQKQFNGGYILERVTNEYGEPNAGFESDPRVVRERNEHQQYADRLIHIHRLRHAMLPLNEIVGEEDYNWLQRVWRQTGSAARWSVAFPIVECFEIDGHPKAKDVFPADLWKSIFSKQSAFLRQLNDEARACIAELKITQVAAGGMGVAIALDAEKARLSQIPNRIRKAIESDLTQALEGLPEKRSAEIKLRATWLANKFALRRKRDGNLNCDVCGFDPASHSKAGALNSRSCLDVHHKYPLEEGVRLTNISDFALLCPTCHRIEHLLLKRDQSQLKG